MNLLPADRYIVVNKTNLQSSVRIILTALYQPIVGSNAINLYFTLWTYLDKREIISNEWTHHHLMTSMRLDLESIKDARLKLEGIGLIKTYVKESSINSYVFELYSPLEPYDFFSNPILNSILYNNIGKIEYERLVSFFQLPKISLNDYKDITLNFSDVFEVVKNLPVETLGEDIKRNRYRNLEIISKIDLNEILSQIPEEMINRRAITKSIKDYIYKLSFIYDLTNEEVLELIKNSINEKRVIDKEVLTINYENYFKFENSGKLPSIAYKLQPEHLKKNNKTLSKRDKMIHAFETTSPHDYLLSKNNYAGINKNDREVLSYLLLELDLNPGVVNVLIDYVLRINNQKLVKKFIEVIAIQWKRHNIKTVEEAMDLAEKEYKSKNIIKETRTRNKVIDKDPEWLNKDIKSKELDADKKKELEELLKEYK